MQPVSAAPAMHVGLIDCLPKSDKIPQLKYAVVPLTDERAIEQTRHMFSERAVIAREKIRQNKLSPKRKNWPSLIHRHVRCKKKARPVTGPTTPVKPQSQRYAIIDALIGATVDAWFQSVEPDTVAEPVPQIARCGNCNAPGTLTNTLTINPIQCDACTHPARWQVTCSQCTDTHCVSCMMRYNGGRTSRKLEI